MQKLDNEFFEAYKRLDRLCSDIYGCPNGVSKYIENMEQEFSRGRLIITSWEQSYKSLKHMRWIRNQLAHVSGESQICTVYYLRYVKRFYDDIISGRDPLAQLRIYREGRSARLSAPSKKRHPAKPNTSAPIVLNQAAPSATEHHAAGCLAALIFLTIAALAVFIYLLFLLL